MDREGPAGITSIPFDVRTPATARSMSILYSCSSRRVLSSSFFFPMSLQSLAYAWSPAADHQLSQKYLSARPRCSALSPAGMSPGLMPVFPSSRRFRAIQPAPFPRESINPEANDVSWPRTACCHAVQSACPFESHSPCCERKYPEDSCLEGNASMTARV